MMEVTSTYRGERLSVSIYGASHAKEIGVLLTGFPAAFPVDLEKLQAFLKRRAPGNSVWSTARKEADLPEFLSGLKDGKTSGEEIRARILNTNQHSKDYEKLKNIPRPGHADYTAFLRYHGELDMAGGGPFSGRMTAPLCIAGGLALQVLEERGIHVMARIRSIGPVTDDSAFESPVDGKDFPAVDDWKAAEMKALIAQCIEEGDSVGGVIECVLKGVPGGLGGPLFDGMESRIAHLLFAIPAVKGVEFGRGFESAALKGSENNDPFILEAGEVRTLTNNAGGILGGITDGMPLVFRAALKPTPSIAKPQQSVDLERMEETTLEVTGRHDPCIVPRAVPVVEAAAALAVLDALLSLEE